MIFFEQELELDNYCRKRKGKAFYSSCTWAGLKGITSVSFLRDYMEMYKQFPPGFLRPVLSGSHVILCSEGLGPGVLAWLISLRK